MNNRTELSTFKYRDRALSAVKDIHVGTNALNRINRRKCSLLVTASAEDKHQRTLIIILEHAPRLKIKKIYLTVRSDIDVAYLRAVSRTAVILYQRISKGIFVITEVDKDVRACRVHLLENVRIGILILCYGVNEVIVIYIEVAELNRNASLHTLDLLCRHNQLPESVHDNLTRFLNAVCAVVSVEFALAREYDRASCDSSNADINILGSVDKHLFGSERRTRIIVGGIGSCKDLKNLAVAHAVRVLINSELHYTLILTVGNINVVIVDKHARRGVEINTCFL